MRDKTVTKGFYTNLLGFTFSGADYDDYLMLHRDGIEIHFFAFPELDPKENDGQVYIRVKNINKLYQSFLDAKVPIHPNGSLTLKPWGQKEFSILDPDANLLTFGEGL